MTEEMTHVLMTLGNLALDSIVSVHGEMLGATYGDDQFDSNSRGLCLAVLILLEM